MRHAFHQATVAEKDIRAMIDNVMAVTVEFRRQHALRQRHAYRIREALAQRAGGGLHAGRHAVLRMAWSFGVQLAEVFQFRDRQLVARQVQQRIQQHRTMPVREHKAVAINPRRVRRIMT